ncbi:hypothetical protein SAMN05660284_01526 [Formivibrio citricus]|uniref:CopG family transcriptional regulator n=1 Tax=Formivibrio citricus TaxID=83765 RepID=A0A1I4Z5R5_9NEIS|nr:hypothetical protein [Formivibrio citricus]SFN45230.1 hypothetical protein SAMN05660284_01526 [Formivibrio citricus]
MLTVSLPIEIENAVLSAAHRHGQSVDEFVASVFQDALMLEEDRARLDAVLSGLPVVPHEAADAWLAKLAAGEAGPCPH